MHENRETSRASAENADRSAKAQSRTADVYAMEESDCCVVPVKQPNKEGKPLAEAVEGRRQPKENDAQSDIQPTQRGERVSQRLSGVRRVAREKKREQFTALLHHVTVNLLRGSFDALKKNAAPGVDGVTWRDYETGLEDRLIDLHSRVHRGTYRAKPSRRVYIPKADGRQRPLGIAAVEDKIVQQAVVTVLNEIYETDFKGFSYGFRPGLNAHEALDALNAGLQKKRVNWISLFYRECRFCVRKSPVLPRTGIACSNWSSSGRGTISFTGEFKPRLIKGSGSGMVVSVAAGMSLVNAFVGEK
jgi:RNA-directed DNA polymerase